MNNATRPSGLLDRLLDWLSRTTSTRRKGMVRGHGFTEAQALAASRGWLVSGFAVRFARAEDGSVNTRTWEV